MPGDSGRSSFMRAARAGSLLALVLDVLMLSAGHFSLWHQMGLLGSFYDVQGRALLHGHLAVPAGSVSFEGFIINGRTYVYFGLVPAILRLPILLVTHSLDGRLTQLSMLLALCILLAAGARVHWRVREFLQPRVPVSATERRAVFLLAVALGAGGVPLFLASWPVVYHEAALWGAALSLAAIDAVLGVIDAPTGRRIAGAGALSALAVNSRISVGLGPIIALGLLALAVAARSSFGPARPESPRRTFAYLTLAAVLALGSAAAINEVKFHSAFGIPLSKQIDTQIDPTQRAFVAANHGAAVGAKFVPTTLLAAVRPDAIGTVRAFPFIGLPSSPPTVIGSVRFNALLPSLSAVTSMPLFCLLLLAGLPALVRRPETRPLVGVLIGTALAFVPALSFGSTATRYLADLLPFLFVGACAGLQALLGSPRLASAAARQAALGAAAVLLVGGILINGSVGLVQQRLLAPTTSTATRAAFVRTQDDIDSFLGRAPTGVHTGPALPSGSLGPLGDLFVLGHCAGLYVESFGGTWLAVERTARAGLHELLVRFPAPQRKPTPQALLALGAGAGRVTVAVVDARPGRAVFSVRVGGRTVATGAPVRVVPRVPTPVTVSIDPLNGASFLSVAIAGGTAVTAPVPYDRLARALIGADPANASLARFSGAVAAVAETTPVCDHVAARAHLL